MISIVTPVYNAESYIQHTMEMVQAQTYTDWELLLVDDGSKDNSVAVITSGDILRFTQTGLAHSIYLNLYHLRWFSQRPKKNIARVSNFSIKRCFLGLLS